MHGAGDETAARQRLLADLATDGLHVVHVAASGKGPTHSYSVGLWDNFDQPEVIVFGLEPEVATELMEAIADEAEAQRPCQPGTRRDGLLADYQVRFLGLDATTCQTWLERTHWAYDGAPFPAVQLVWPDKQGRWPWDPAAREGFRSMQPLLAPPT